jgi:hypothetical protein
VKCSGYSSRWWISPDFVDTPHPRVGVWLKNRLKSPAVKMPHGSIYKHCSAPDVSADTDGMETA